MQVLITKARYILCALIILAFFIPSYHNVSGFTFIPLAFSEAKGPSEITSADVFIAIIPLVLIPVSALAILLTSYFRRPVRKSFRVLPLVSLFVFTVILFMSLRSVSGGGRSSLRTLSHLQGGFYVVAVAAVLLPFSRNPNRRKARRPKPLETEMAV